MFQYIRDHALQQIISKNIAKMGLSSSLNALKDRGQNKSVIYATIHMGNWELAGVSLNLIGAPIFSIARPQKINLLMLI